MNTVVVGFALLLTITLALGLGIATAYAAISAILHLFGNHQRPSTPSATLIHSPSATAGD